MATAQLVISLSGYLAAVLFATLVLLQGRQLRTWRMDELTGLHVRREFYRRAQRALRRGAHVLVFIDLDRFKPINDRYGYEMGDATLTLIGARLTKVLGPKALIGRLGGDEFAVVLTPSPEQTTQQLLYRLVQAIADPIDLQHLAAKVGIPFDHTENVSHVIGASVGAVDLSEVRSPELSGSLHVAAQLMAEVKHTGGGINLLNGEPHDARLVTARSTRPLTRLRDSIVDSQR
jgi:diguanylate cyclase (GGDEF)-like protein